MKKTMKVMALLLCAIMMATVLSSCSKEDSYQKKIIGRWSFTNEVDYYYDASNTLVNTEDFSVGFVVEFTDSGNFIVGGLRSVPFSINDNTLMIGGAEDYDIYEIDELTSTKMVWKEQEPWTDGGSGAYKIMISYFEKLTD